MGEAFFRWSRDTNPGNQDGVDFHPGNLAFPNSEPFVSQRNGKPRRDLATVRMITSGGFWLPATRSSSESSRSLNIGFSQSKSDLFGAIGQFMEAT